MSIASPPAFDAWFRSPQMPAVRTKAAHAQRTSIAARWSAKVVRNLAESVMAIAALNLDRPRQPARHELPAPLQPDVHQGLLVDAFTPLRQQAGTMLRAAGMTLVWTSGHGIGTLRLATHTVQGLRQIAQEALEEALHQNSEPRAIHLELELLRGETGSHLRMAVIDPAGRSPCQAPLRVRGLSMAQRHATQLGAQLDIGVEREGWCVELVLQLAPA